MHSEREIKMGVATSWGGGVKGGKGWETDLDVYVGCHRKNST